MLTGAELQAAMDSYHPIRVPALSEYSTLRPSPPRKPISTEVVLPLMPGVPPQVASERPVLPVDEPAWLIRIDIAAWRRCGWMWRLAASVVMRRLRRPLPPELSSKPVEAGRTPGGFA